MKRIAPLLIPLLLACGCDLMQSTKGGVETTNGLSGIIKDQSGNPVAHAQVVLVPEAYNGAEPAISVAPEKTETDADGRYRFNHVVPGPYNLESNLPVRNLKAWLPGLDIGEAQADAPIPDMALKAPGILKIPFADRHLAENALLFIPGTTIAMPIVGKIDSGGDLMVPGLPEGRFPSLMAYFPDTVDGGKLAVCPAFTIHSGDTTSIAGLASWSGRKTIHLDLSGAAGLPEPMEGHPILIRLDAANFNFSEAGAGGKDIRFTDSGGTYLPFQIEQWDDASKQAAIWVKLNTLHRDKDSLIFHWGRKDAVGISNGAAVFDSAQGFAAVWHLGEAGNASPGGYKDATIG